MTLDQILDLIRSDPDMIANITHWQKIPAQEAQYDEFPDSIHPDLIQILQQRGINKLFTHRLRQLMLF